MSEWKTSISNILQKTNQNLGYREKADLKTIAENRLNSETDNLQKKNNDQNTPEKNRRDISLLKTDVEEIFKNINRLREEVSFEIHERTSLVHEVARKVRDDFRSELSSVRCEFQDAVQNAISPIEGKQEKNQREMENILFKMKKLEQSNNLQRKELYSKLETVDNQYNNMSKFTGAFNHVYDTVKNVEKQANYWEKRLNNEMKTREQNMERNVLQRIQNLEKEIDQINRKNEIQQIELNDSSENTGDNIEQIKSSLSQCMKTATRVTEKIHNIENNLNKNIHPNETNHFFDNQEKQKIKGLFHDISAENNHTLNFDECLEFLQNIFPNIAKQKLYNSMIRIDHEKDEKFTWNKNYKIILDLNKDGILPYVEHLRESSNEQTFERIGNQEERNSENSSENYYNEKLEKDAFITNLSEIQNENSTSNSSSTITTDYQ